MPLADQLRLMVLTDPVLLKGRDPTLVCQAAVRGGATTIQVRWKDGAPRDLLVLTQALVRALPVPVLVNDRFDVALAAGAAGAHLGQDDLPPAAIRAACPPGFLLGTSVGSPEEANRALEWPVDYWSIGPCYATGNKRDAGPALGPSGFSALRRLAPSGVPVLGIGGITAANAADIVKAGADGVAVIGAVLGAEDAEIAARDLRRALAIADASSRSASP